MHIVLIHCLVYSFLFKDNEPPLGASKLFSSKDEQELEVGEHVLEGLGPRLFIVELYFDGGVANSVFLNSAEWEWILDAISREGKWKLTYKGV